MFQFPLQGFIRRNIQHQGDHILNSDNGRCKYSVGLLPDLWQVRIPTDGHCRSSVGFIVRRNLGIPVLHSLQLHNTGEEEFGHVQNLSAGI